MYATCSCTRIVVSYFCWTFFFFLTQLKSSLFYLLILVCNFCWKKKHVKELECSIQFQRRSKGWIYTRANVFIQRYVHIPVGVLVFKIHLVPMSNFFHLFLKPCSYNFVASNFCMYTYCALCTCITSLSVYMYVYVLFLLFTYKTSTLNFVFCLK